MHTLPARVTIAAYKHSTWPSPSSPKSSNIRSMDGSMLSIMGDEVTGAEAADDDDAPDDDGDADPADDVVSILVGLTGVGGHCWFFGST